jgi:hypothetical protein
MRKFFAPVLIVALAMIGVVATPKEGSAVPSFARQMNLPCFACHFQHIPKLNAFGRAFKLSGYTDTASALIEDEGMSLPTALPISYVAKYRYRVDTKTTASTPDKKGNERGNWDIYDEAALFAAGRAAKNVGYAAEIPSDTANLKVIFTGEAGGLRLGVIPFRTDAGGPFWGMDLSNTGVNNGNKSWEHRTYTSAAGAMGLTTAATGITLYAGGSAFFGAAGLWGPAFANPDTGFDLSMSYRLAATPTLGGFDTLIGVFGTTGKTKCVECGSVGANATSSLQEFKTEITGVDVQAQADLGGMTLELQAQYATSPGDGSIWGKADALSVTAELGITKAVGVAAAYVTKTAKGEKGAKDVTDSATSVSVYYNIAQNVVIKPEYTIMGDNKSDGLDNRMTVMLFMGF